jgi:hypothetical protein
MNKNFLIQIHKRLSTLPMQAAIQAKNKGLLNLNNK